MFRWPHLSSRISVSWEDLGSLLSVGLTWPLLMCSWGRRQRSSAWHPPDSSRPPPRSGHSPWSWQTHTQVKSQQSFVQVLLSWFQPRKTQNKMLLWLNMHKGQTNWPIINIHIILQITHRKKCQTVLWSQISTVVAPDYYLTERQKRWGSKQTRRANEDKASSSLGHNTAGISALVTTGGQLSSGPQIKVMMIHCSGLGWTVWTGKCTRLIFNLNPLRNLHKKQTERNYKSEFWIICWTYE